MADYTSAYTGAQIDAAVGRILTGNAYNLLDNSDFTNLVNQRGQTDYTSNGYTIDRWELYFGAVGVSSPGYITTSGQMYQKIAIPTDKVYTFAIENDAGIAVVTGIPANGIHSATLGNALIKLATIGEYVEVVIEPSEGDNIACAYWAALYEGSYTADTLPPYVPKGYAAELAECQRYYVKYISDSNTPLTVAVKISDTTCRATIMLPTIMRTKSPTVSASGCKANNTTITSINGIGCIGNGIMLNLNCDASTFSYNTGYYLAITPNGSIEISADL